MSVGSKIFKGILIAAASIGAAYTAFKVQPKIADELYYRKTQADKKKKETE